MTADQPQLDADGVPAGAPIVPARITLALDARGLHGPEVDERVGTYEGNPAGDVDAWELGDAIPTREQVRLLAELTHMPVAFFYEPQEPWETEGHMWVCGRSGPNGGGRRVCHQVPMATTPPAAEDPNRARQHALPVRPRPAERHQFAPPTFTSPSGSIVADWCGHGATASADALCGRLADDPVHRGEG